MLEIRNVHKRFGIVHALNDINLNLEPGLFGLLGPNGAGKSTLMRTLATLQKPDEGTITYLGENIVSNPDIMRKSLGYLPQDFGVYPRVSAEKLLNHLAILKGIANKAQRQEQVAALLEQVNLTNKKNAAVSTFSGGMRQRFGVAQALLGNPKILIVDEPTAGLDPLERQRFLDLLSEAGEDKIIILSTHIVEDVRDVCSDMAIMGEGQIVARGDPEDIVEKIGHSVWRKTVEKTDVPKMKSDYNVLSTRLRKKKVVVSIISNDNPGTGFEKVDPKLEDAYFANLYRFV